MTFPDPETRELLSIFYRLARIGSLSSPEEVLENVMRETADLVSAEGCSIYLIPELVSQFDGNFIRGDKYLSLPDSGNDVVVLAATRSEKLGRLIGHAFYYLDEGITGWVFKHGIPLIINNVADEDELSRYSSDLRWLDVYGECQELHKPSGKTPLLAMPLRRGERIFGVIKFLGPKDQSAFSSFQEKIASLIATMVSSTIGNAWLLKEQNNTILRLVEIGNKRQIKDVLCEVTHSLSEILKCNHVGVYINKNNLEVQLEIENGKPNEDPKVMSKGQGLIGWIFKTGKPLIIENVRQFLEKTILTDQLLEMFSNGGNVDQADREIQFHDPLALDENNGPTTFMGLPIWKDKEIYGVLVAYSKYATRHMRKGPFTRIDLGLCTSFSKTISLVLENERDKNLKTLLTDLGFLSNLGELFEKVVRGIPEMVLAANCSIYEYKTGPQGRILKLVQTSRDILFEDKELTNLSYRIGEGKTGFCGIAEATLIINHFGSNDSVEELMEQEVSRIYSEHKDDLVQRLLDTKGIQVGIIQLRGGKELSTSLQQKFRALAQQTIVSNNGLPSAKIDFYNSKSIPLPWSFAAIPIKNDNGLLGVISLTRNLPQSPFSSEDITILESIAGRLATVFGHIKLQEQEKNLLMSLAHEINTPITGVLADSENLNNELKSRNGVADLVPLARNNLEQVQRLQLLTETIMGVLSENKSRRNFEFVNISSLLEEARELFVVEAAQKGCDILRPKSIGEDRFPEIEMSRFDLGIAIKNILHNAVKYSFHATNGGEKHRYVNIWGIWADSGHQVYKINIQNYGVGISQEEIDKRLIFYAYYRGEKANDRRRTGAGFGLAHARQVIEDMHDGKIEVTSIPSESGDGYQTTFTILLPAIHRSKHNSF